MPTPAKLVACWWIMTVGGALAVMMSLALIFDVGSCCMLLPTVYYGLLTGILAIAHGVGRSTRGLSRVSNMQICNIVNCDVFSLFLGIINRVLLADRTVKHYLCMHRQAPS